MAIEEGRTSGGNGFLYFAVGALIVGVGVLAWMFYNGSTQARSDSAVERMADSVSGAVDKIGDSARDASRKLPEPAPVPAPAPSPAPTN